MTLLDIERLTRRISEVLQPGANHDAAPRLAEEFSHACRSANLRLQQCESMIRANDRLQAIQLAETTPNLLDLISLLEFPNAADWRTFCQKNALPAAERIDARAVQELKQCYAQGISTDHPLYAAYRKATLTRNDEEALRALRTIARLNPSDANAASELSRLDAKVLSTHLEHLGQVLAGGDSALTVAEIENIESAGFKTLPEGEAWNKAALVRCGVLLEEAANAKAASQWTVALNKIELIRRLQQDLKLELPAEQLQSLTELEKWTRAEQEKDRQNREFNTLLSQLRKKIHDSEEKDTSARYIELPEMRADFEALHKNWRALTDFTRPIPEDVSSAFQKRSALLEAEIARRMSVRRRIIFASATAVLLVGAAIVWFVLSQMKGRQFARELQNTVAQQQTHAAERLLQTLQNPGNHLLRVGAVNVAAANAESFVNKEHELLANFDADFAKLPTQVTGEPEAARINGIANQLAATRAALIALSPDLKAENEPRLNAFDRQWQQYLSDATGGINNSFEQSVAAAEKQCAQLDYRSPAEAAKQLSALSGAVQQIGEYEAGFTNQISLRSDLLERAAAVQARFDVFDHELKKLDSGLASLNQARSLADFSAAINSMASSEFSGAPAAVAANAVQSLAPGEESVLRSLLNATNPATWAFIKRSKSPTLIPEVAMPAEQSRLEKLIADPAVSGDHQHYRFWLDGNQTKKVDWITAGTLDNSLGWKKIDAWTVDPGDAKADFSAHDYGCFNGEWKLSANQPVYRLDHSPDLNETAVFAAAEIAKITPAAGVYNRPLLQVLDTVKDSDQGSPIFRAYLLCELLKAMEFQPDEWGLSFCPSARAHAAQIHSIVGGEISSGDWFVPAKINAWNDKLVEFFAGAKSVSYLKQAAGNLALAQAAARDGLHYIGFAGLDGKPTVTAGLASSEIWGYDARTKQPALITGAAMPLSPLFALPLSRADYLAKAGVDPHAAAFASTSLPLFRSKN